MAAQNAGQAANNLDKKHICFSIVGFNKKRIDAVEVGIKGWMMDFRMSDG